MLVFTTILTHSKNNTLASVLCGVRQRSFYINNYNDILHFGTTNDHKVNIIVAHRNENATLVEPPFLRWFRHMHKTSVFAMNNQHFTFNFNKKLYIYNDFEICQTISNYHGSGMVSKSYENHCFYSDYGVLGIPILHKPQY